MRREFWFWTLLPILIIVVGWLVMSHTVLAQEKEAWSWVENERGEDYLTHYRSDDNRINKMESFGGPISYWAENGWRPIDTTITPSATRDFEMVRAPYQVFLLSDPTQPKPVEFVRVFNGVPYSISYKPVSLGWVGLMATATPTQPSTGASSESEFGYSDIFGPGTDLRYELRNTSMKELLEVRDIRDLPAAPPGTTALELRFALEFTEGLACVVDGVPWDRASRVETDDRIYFTFKGENVFWMGKPRAHDNARKRTALTYVLEAVGRELHVSLLAPYPWLSDKGRAYPITLDPTTYVSTASDGDIWLWDYDYEAAWGAVEGMYIGDEFTTFKIGQYLEEGAFTIYRAFLFFDTSSIGAGATVTGAALSLYLAEDQSDADFDIVITRSIAPELAPHDPLENGDYSVEWGYDDIGGFIGTEGLAQGEYFDIDLDELGWISKAGTTVLVLRSDLDIDAFERFC